MKKLLLSQGAETFSCFLCGIPFSFFIYLETTPDDISEILDRFDDTIMDWSHSLPNPAIYKKERATSSGATNLSSHDSEEEDSDDDKTEEDSSVAEMDAAVAAGRATTSMSKEAKEESDTISTSPMYKGLVLFVRALLKRRSEDSMERARIYLSLERVCVMHLFLFFLFHSTLVC